MIRLGGACGAVLVRGLLLMVVSTQQDWHPAAWHVQVARHRPQHVVDMAKDCGGDEAHFVDHYAANVVQAHAAFAEELGTGRRHGDVRELPGVACVLARDAQGHESE